MQEDTYRHQRRRLLSGGMLAITRKSTSSSSTRSSKSEDDKKKSKYRLIDDERKLPPPVVFWSDNEKDAYRKNRVIQNKLNSDLDDIRLHREHSSRVIKCDSMRFRQHASRLPQLTPLRVGGWSYPDQTWRRGSISRQSRYSTSSSWSFDEEEEEDWRNLAQMNSLDYEDEVEKLTLTCIVAPLPNDRSPVIRTPLQKRTPGVQVQRSSSVRLKPRVPPSISLNPYPERKIPKRAPIQIPFSSPESASSCQDVAIHNEATVDDNLITITDVKLELDEDGRRCSEGKKIINSSTEDHGTQTDTSYLPGQHVNSGQHRQVGSLHDRSKHQVRKAADTKKVRWGNTEYMFLRSKTTLDNTSSSLVADGKSAGPPRPILNVKRALTCEKLKYENSQAKVADYVRQLATCGFSPQPEVKPTHTDNKKVTTA